MPPLAEVLAAVPGDAANAEANRRRLVPICIPGDARCVATNFPNQVKPAAPPPPRV